eukprot:scpid31610/ scgid22363/ 
MLHVTVFVLVNFCISDISPCIWAVVPETSIVRCGQGFVRVVVWRRGLVLTGNRSGSSGWRKPNLPKADFTIADLLAAHFHLCSATSGTSCGNRQMIIYISLSVCPELLVTLLKH